MVVEVIYEKGILRPLLPLEGLREGEKFEVEIKSDTFPWKGALKGVNLSSVELQHEIKNVWGKKHVSD